MSYFWHSYSHNFDYICGKVTKLHFLENSDVWKNEKNVFFEAIFSKRNCLHLEFLMNQIFEQRFIIFENWGIAVNYCWNYKPSKLLIHFTEYHLGQENSSKLDKTISWKPLSRGMSRKSFKIFVHLKRNDSLVKFLQNWTETIF